MRVAGRVAVVALLLPVLGACASGQATRQQSGAVSGVVLSAPSCPVERAGSPCPPRPVPGADVTATRGATTVAHVTAGADGRFTIHLDAGAYTITARAVGGIGSTASAHVTIPAGGVATATLTVDSGIR